MLCLTSCCQGFDSYTVCEKGRGRPDITTCMTSMYLQADKSGKRSSHFGCVFLVLNNEGQVEMLKYGNRNTEAKIQKRKY